MSALKSGVVKRYYKYFILEEDSLRRIQAVFSKAAKDLPDASEVVFHIEREDDRFYETISIDDVLSDPNVLGKRIWVVSVELRSRESKQEHHIYNPHPIATLKFASGAPRSNRRDEVHLEISHDNRNWALLFADEIEPQIQRTFKSKGFPKWIFFLLLIPLLPAFFKNLVKASQNLGGKPPEPLILWWMVIAIPLSFMFVFLHDPPSWAARVIGRESIFLWGDEVQEYNTIQKTRQNIIWGVVVAFIVSFAAGGLWLIY